jgi:hypothetical protein
MSCSSQWSVSFWISHQYPTCTSPPSSKFYSIFFNNISLSIFRAYKQARIKWRTLNNMCT